MAELKKCPFCGSTNIGYSLKLSGLRGPRYYAALYCKECNCYGARILSAPMPDGYPGRVKAENDTVLFSKAKEAWNRRADNV